MLQKKMKKRYSAFFLVFMLLTVFVFSLTGCGERKTKEIKGIEDLSGAVIGVQLGTTGDLYASDYEKEGSVIERFTKAADSVQALKSGKIDCIVIDKSPAEAFVEKNPELSILKENFALEDYAICISKEKSELKNKINIAIAELKENGTLERIISNYIGDDTKGKFPYKSPENIDRSNGVLKMATNATFEPYEYIENNEYCGIDIDLGRAICDKLGMELQIDDIEFDSIIGAVQSGKSDIGLSGMTVTEERLKTIDFTDSYTTATQVVIVKSAGTGKELTFSEKLHQNFLQDSRWKYITNGLIITLQISFFSVLIGLILGFLIAILRSTCDKRGKYKLLNIILKIYLTVIRGTPTMVQLLIIYYVIFASSSIDKVIVAIIAFGLNSSAYIAEIVRAGIMSIDEGQFEAGRSLGFNYAQTMRYFIIPQAFKNILPALCNEFIVLIKETSISGYIGIMDLTRGGDYIRSRTFEAFLPLIAIAIVYLVVVMVLTMLVSKLEKRLKNDER